MNKPIILDNALERVGNNDKMFEYNYLKDMNVVLVNEKVVPFIDMNSDTSELITKTRVDRESDDEGFSLLELETKTEVAREQDEEEISFAELETKTFVDRERDDEDDFNYN